MQILKFNKFNFRLIIIFLGTFTAIDSIVNAVNVQGTYANAEFGVAPILGRVYRYSVYGLQCSNNYNVASQFYCTDSEIVAAVGGVHVYGYLNDDVKGLAIIQQTISYLPTGFATFFKYLEGLEVSNSGLKVIRSRDLTPFKKLRLLVMQGNNIKSLAADVFAGNVLLESIYMPNNEFIYIDSTAFNTLTRLSNATFQSNPCVNLNANTIRQLPRLITEFAEKCAPVQQQITQMVTTQNMTVNVQIAELNMEISNLKKINSQLQASLISLRTELINKFETESHDCNRQLGIIGGCMLGAAN